MDSEMTFREKLDSLSFSHKHRGKSNTTPVVRDTDGTVGGERTEHWDDRVDMKVTKADIHINPNLIARRIDE